MTPFRQEPENLEMRLDMHASLTRFAMPPAQQHAFTLPWLYSAILGNGRMLACLDATGALAQLFYPHIDVGPHVRTFHLGVRLTPLAPERDAPPERVWWLADASWQHVMTHIDRAAGVRIISTNADAGIRLERALAAHPTEDALIMECAVSTLRDVPVACKLIVFAGFDIDHRQSGATCHFASDHSSLVFYGKDRYFALRGQPPVINFATDQVSAWGEDQLFAAVDAGHFNATDFAIGRVSGAVCYDLGMADGRAHHLYLACGRTLEQTHTLGAALLARRASVAEAVAWWHERYRNAWLARGSETTRRLFDRSLITLNLLTDRATGGIIAAPEMDPTFQSCGGYGYCWPRDGAFIAHALDTVGQHAHARNFYDWALANQHEKGIWLHRYDVQGRLGPSWGMVQFDETGMVVWALCQHILLTGDLDYARKVWPSLVRACESMQAALDAETGLAPFTVDLWEEIASISAYACACTFGGFQALAQVAEKLGEREAAAHWHSAAEQMRNAIATHLWDAEQQRFLRSRNLLINVQEAESRHRHPDFSPDTIREVEIHGKKRHLLVKDPTLDISILGLSLPFNVFAPDDPRIVATAGQMAERLRGPNGGIKRYEHDNYRGGNPWILTTLWLAWQRLAQGDRAGAQDLYQWVLAHRTRLDLLPEQVDRRTGEPCWVVPLAWSHAMFILVANMLDE